MPPTISRADPLARARVEFRDRGTRRAPGGGPLWAAAKRAFDVALATLMLLSLAPLLAVVAVAIKLDAPGPVLFRQRRLGRDMRAFAMLKFRTMSDMRVTRVGRVLRGLALDQLPQLLNVLGGTMSLVGPRPAVVYELEHYRPTHFERFLVRPGLTGVWQLAGRERVDLDEMLDLDAGYAEICGPLTDARIFLRTIAALVRDPG